MTSSVGPDVTCDGCGSAVQPRDGWCQRCFTPVRFSEDTGCWSLGSDRRASIVVPDPTVSPLHAILRCRDQRYWLQDAGSTTGTFVNGQRLSGEQEVQAGAQVVLGRCDVTALIARRVEARGGAPGATPKHEVITLSVGRAADSDIRLNDDQVSRQHAVLTLRAGVWAIDDCGSRNGIAINQRSARVESATRFNPATDTFYFGSYEVKAASLLAGGPGRSGRSLAMSKNTVVIGRGHEADVYLENPTVCDRHASISRQGGRLTIRDLHSTNGSFVNGARVAGDMALKAGDVIVLGGATLILQDSQTLVYCDPRESIVIAADGVAVTGRRRGVNHRLLEGVSLVVRPGEMVAIMGSAGAGKTTLLKALCGFQRPSQGQVLYNGESLYEALPLFRQSIGYVPQDDIMHPELTVRESLRMAAMLRSERSREQADADVVQVLRDLEILDVADKVIGSPADKVLSGGQRKRVNIAMELLSNPACLFLDEPTSGLSSRDALVVMRVLRTVAHRGTAVLTTIHQPSADLFALFDLLVLLKRDRGATVHAPARLVYVGRAGQPAFEFFSDPGLSCTNVEEMVDVVEAAEPSAAAWESKFRTSAIRTEYVDARLERLERTIAGRVAPRIASVRQIGQLLERAARLKVADRVQRALMVLQPSAFAALIVLLFPGLDVNHPATEAALINLRGGLTTVHFLLAIGAVWFGCNNAVREVVSESVIFIRERAVNVSLQNYLLSKYILLGFISLAQCALLATVVWAGCALEVSLPFLIGVLWLTSLVGASIGLAISSAAALWKGPEGAVASLPLVLLPMILLGGGVYPLFELEAKTTVHVPGTEYSYPLSRLLSAGLAPTRWAFELTLVDEASRRKPHLEVPLGVTCQGVLDTTRSFESDRQEDAVRMPTLVETPGIAVENLATGLATLNRGCEQLRQAGRDVAALHFPDDRGPGRTHVGWALGAEAALVLAGLLAATITLRRFERQELGTFGR